MTFGDETGDYSSIQNYQSVDSKKFNNKLSIEDTYAEIDGEGNLKNLKNLREDSAGNVKPEYAVIDIQKKREGRRQRLLKGDDTSTSNEENTKEVVIYEDVGADNKANNDDGHIYELVRLKTYSIPSLFKKVTFLIRNLFHCMSSTRSTFPSGHHANPAALYGKTGRECTSSTSRNGKPLKTAVSLQAPQQSTRDRKPR